MSFEGPGEETKAAAFVPRMFDNSVVESSVGFRFVPTTVLVGLALSVCRMPNSEAVVPLPTSLIVRFPPPLSWTFKPVLVTVAVIVLPAGGLRSNNRAMSPIVAALLRLTTDVLVPLDREMLPASIPWPLFKSASAVELVSEGLRLMSLCTPAEMAPKASSPLMFAWINVVGLE